MKFENYQLEQPDVGNPVLIVEDDASQRLLLSEILKGAGFRVKQAACANEAIQLLADETFDLVLLDKGLPDMDGDQVIRVIREELNLPLLPVIMVTGHISSKTLQASLQAGASDFVRKPFEHGELIARVKAAIRQKHLIDQQDSIESVLFALSRMVEAKDSNTAEHCTRLLWSCQVFGDALQLSADDMESLIKGAVLHDIGKVGIPDSLLRKPGKFNEQEWAVMKRHPVIGSRLCKGLNSVRKAVPIIMHHHERWDGSGYPDGLSTQKIPRLARIFQLVDIYDALRFDRPYNEPQSIQRVIGILESELHKGWRDPQLTGVFLDILRKRPDDLENGASDRLDSGQALYRKIVGSDGLLFTEGEM